MEPPILEFQGEYRWLSNFAPVLIQLPDGDYPSVEHAYQAEKTIDPVERRFIRTANSPGEAKRRGRRVTIRPDWDDIKVDVMYRLVQCKFKQEPYRSRLIATGSREIVEGNRWGDTFWGMCHGKGTNMLGKLIMEVRSEIS